MSSSTGGTSPATGRRPAPVGDVEELGSHDFRPLLTMTAGWTADYYPEPARPQLVRRVLTAGPDGDPGTFVYSDIGPHLLSGVLAPGEDALGRTPTC